MEGKWGEIEEKYENDTTFVYFHPKLPLIASKATFYATANQKSLTYLLGNTKERWKKTMDFPEVEVCSSVRCHIY